MAEFRRERVFFTVIGQGSVEWEAENDVETPAEAFSRFVNPEPHAIAHLGLVRLLEQVDDFDYVITCAIEPTPDCPDCEGTGMIMHGPNEVTCGTCEGRKVSVPRVEKSDDPDEMAPW